MSMMTFNPGKAILQWMMSVSMAGLWPLAIPLIAGAGSFLGGLFGKKSKQKTTQTSSTMPKLDPAYQPLQGLILPQIMQRLQNPSKLPPGFEQRGIGDINKTYDLAGQSLNNRLTSRGLGRSPVAGVAEGKHETGRAGAIVNFQQQLPLIERQMQDQDFQTALQTLGYGRGSASTGQSESTGTAGGGLGGGLQSLAEMLMFQYGMGNFGNGGGGLGPAPPGSGGWSTRP